MAKKIITARDVLAQKSEGQEPTKFDTNGFINTVGRFFLRHEVWDTIMVKPVIFAKHKKFVEAHEITKGWFYIRTVYEHDKYGRIFDWKKNHDDWNLDWNYHRDFKSKCIHVDAPFIKNAIATLQVMGGYTVKYSRKDEAYIVSLQ